jgi:uncharacterized membrane protein YfhO
MKGVISGMPFPSKIRENKITYYLIYYILPFTAAFLVLQFIVYHPFAGNNKSFIWDLDGLNQHYPALVYYSRRLKDLLEGKGFPMVDFSIGMGFDTLTTLNYYAIGDPLTLLSIFGKEGNMEEIYRFLILLRIYLSGISFILYCIYMKKKSFPSVISALIYIFCGYVLFAGVRHPYFTNPFIYLPLLFIGIELILQKKKPYLFIIMTFLSALSNFYFFYMITIILAVYGVIRFFHTSRHVCQGSRKFPMIIRRNMVDSPYKEGSSGTIWKSFFNTALRAGIYYLLGVAMSGVILLPVIGAFLNNGRFNSGYHVNLLHYSLGYYAMLAGSFLAPNITPGFWTQCTFAAVMPVAVLVVFRRKKYRELKLFFILATVCLMVPFMGFVMNGFSYVSNRWEFGYCFLIAYLFAMVYDDIFQLNKADKALLGIGTLIYGALGLLKPNGYVFYSFLTLCVTTICIILLNSYKVSVHLQRTIIFLLVFCNLGLNGYFTYSSKFGNYVEEFVDAGSADKTISNSEVSMLTAIQDDSFYRVETYGDQPLNEALTLNFHDVSGYYSIMDKRVSEYMKGLELLSQKAAYRFDNLDYRSGLSTLAGVKYLVTTNKTVAPYGYHLIKMQQIDDKSCYLFENQYALSLGYTYGQYITREQYEKLNPLQKQEIMLQAVVLEKPVAGVLENSTALNQTGFSMVELPFTLTCGKGITRTGEYIDVTESGAKLTIHFNGLADSESYLQLKGFNLKDTDYYSLNFKLKGENKATKLINVRSDRNSAYFGKEDYLINLGSRKSSMQYCELSFPRVGRFHLSSIKVYGLPMSNYVRQVKERKKGELYNIKVQNNYITGTVETDEGALLCLAVPYSKGWKAYVNGVKTKPLQANIMYLALPVGAGTNDIELYYETPLLRTGAAVSVTGWFLFLCLILFDRIKRGKRGKI